MTGLQAEATYKSKSIREPCDYMIYPVDPAPSKDTRDLSFKPVVNDAPLRLTEEQIKGYNEQGYVMPLSAYTPAEADQNRAYFDDMLERVQRERSDLDAYAINGFQSHCAGLYDITMNPIILDHVQDILGPNFLSWGTHFFCKLAGYPRNVAWHQDASYWPFTPSRTVTVWLAIDDTDKENSAMKFLPGTHNKGLLKWRETDGTKSVLGQEIEGTEQMGEPVYDVLKAGEFSLHADMLAHGSERNTSDRRRCGLTIRYCTPDVRAMNPRWTRGAILCRGVDESGHWTHNARPPGENIHAMVKAIGGN